jgi:plasmid stability protein
MKRTLIQLDDEIYRRLRQHAFRHERSISSVVREMVAKGLEGEVPRHGPTRVAEFASVRAGRSKQGRLSPISEKHDEALSTAFQK